MSFANPWLLLLVPLPVIWAAAQWRRAFQHRTRLAIKAATFCLILLALAQPRLTYSDSRMAVGLLVDTSASVSDADLDRASSVVSDIQKHRGSNWTIAIPFARGTRRVAASEHKGSWHLVHTAGEGGRSTDLEAAIREALGAMPPGRVPRLVLISDGKENRGSVARGGWQARELGIPIDTYALSGKSRPALHLDSVTMPTIAYSGDKFPIDLMVSSPRDAPGSVEISAEGKSLGSNRVDISQGTNQLRVHANLSASGAIEVSGVVKAPGLGEVEFARAITLRRPKILYVSDDPAPAEKHFTEMLTSSQFDVDRVASLGTIDLRGYQMVVLNNTNLEAIPLERKSALEDFVKQGGGLLVIGGERNIYVDHKGVEDALGRALPADLAPPRSPEGTCVVLIIDKSSSMEGRKIELARLAAIGVIENLRPIDSVGVLIFDNSFQWAVPIRRAEDRSLIKRLIAGIMPDGGTQIAPALNESFRRILGVHATYKHIVLLTDGISEEGDSLSLAREATEERVTISTVGLGQDVNRAYLEKVAALARGKSYFLTDPSGLEQILLRDVMEHTGSTAIEKPVYPVVLKKAEILEGVGIEQAPPLHGYVRFIPKPSAETLLSIERRDPLFTRWQYGLGRAAVFTSDAKARWASQWVSWKGYDRFWGNVFREVVAHTEQGDANVQFDSANGELVVDYRLSRRIDEPAKTPSIFVFGPEGFQRPVEVRKVADGSYRGRVEIGNRHGLFRVRPLEESHAFPETGIYREEEELSEFGSNELLLRQIAQFTGGRFQPAAADIFDPGGRSQPSTMNLWPMLLALAVALNVAEVLLRKRLGILETLRGGRAERAA